MKKSVIATIAAASSAVLSCAAATNINFEKGRMEVYDFDQFKLHVYYTNDAMGDASFIIEGKKALVTMEQPLFKDNVVEFDSYLESLRKPVETRISDYHLGGTANEPTVSPEGMPDFMAGPVYSGMMAGFAKNFGDAIVDLPEARSSEVPFNSTQNYAGVDFTLLPGPSNDFPGANILIGGKVHFSHRAPSKAHPSTLQVNTIAAVEAQIVSTKAALDSGAEIFIGGHGGAAGRDAVEFKLGYLQNLKALYEANDNAEDLAKALKEAYPDLPGDADALAASLYSKNPGMTM